MKYSILVLSLLLAECLAAQPALPVIKATSKNVSINDGGILDKNAWSLSPKARPDIYTADRTRKTKWVTFYTDIDSIRVKLKPGRKIDFIILLNGKDSCYTRIASAVSNAPMPVSDTHDTIPFTLTEYNAIKIRASINDTDSLDAYFDASSYDFHITRDAILKKTKLLSGQPDAMTGKAAPNFNKLNKVTKLQLGTMILKDPSVAPTGLTAYDMDAKIGWTLFDNRIVEIDYDHNWLIVYSKLPKKVKGYTRSDLEFIRDYPCVKAAFIIDGKAHSGNFMLDTGSDQAMILDSAWTSSQRFPSGLKLIKTSEIRDPRGKKYTTRVIRFPLFSINKHELSNIPALVLGSNNPAGTSINFLGNDVLKRFNILLDFKKDQFYARPNRLTAGTYRAES